MAITNKADERKTRYDEVIAFVNSITNPQIEEHVNALPIPPQAKEFFIKLTKTVMLMARKVID